MSVNPTSWLAREVTDLLTAGSVGLYEFLWILRGTRADLSDDEIHGVASSALDLLLQNGLGRLVWLTWASDDEVENVLLRPLVAADWNDPEQDKPYLAIKPKS